MASYSIFDKPGIIFKYPPIQFDYLRIKMMGTRKNRLALLQFTIILFVWILLLAVPVLFGNFPQGIEWGHIFRMWSEYFIIFIVFLINRFLLLPMLFYKGRKAVYFLTLITLVSILATSFYFAYSMNNPPRIGPTQSERNIERLHSMPPPGHLPPQRGPVVPAYANLIILSILIIGFDTGLNISIKWVQSEQNRMQLEKENTENKLAFLQNQISPHFFMNTLNNIHALVDINSFEAKESIIKLSRLMGFLLYESKIGKVPLQKELQFVRSYVELMGIRFSSQVKITLDIPDRVPTCHISPMLFVSFIENAFKHGVSYEKPSYVEIKFTFKKEWLEFEVINSKHNGNGRSSSINSGIGLENSRKRLDLLFGKSYELNIDNSENTYKVYLSIPL